MGFIERLKQVLETEQVSQVDFAKSLNITTGAINSYISGKRKPNFEVLHKISNLGYNINWLLTGKGSIKVEMINFETLDSNDKEIIDIYNLIVGTGKYNLTLNENLESFDSISTKQRSDHILSYLYRNGIIRALERQLTLTKDFIELEEALIYPHFKEVHIFRDILGAIDLFLAEGKTQKRLTLKENVLIDSILRNISNVYVIYLEVSDLRIRLEEVGYKTDLNEIKSIYVQLKESMDNELFLRIKSRRFIKSVAQTFGYKEENNY